MDPFMSHVLEKLLILLSFDKNEEANNKTTPDQLLKDKEWVLKVCRFVTNNLEDFSLDMYASHLLRTCVQCLTGHRIENKGNPSDSQRTEGYNIRTVWKFSKEDEENFKEVLEIFQSRILSLSADIICSEVCVYVLQVYMDLVWKTHPKLVKAIIKHLFTICWTEDFDWEDVPTVRIIEHVVKYGLISEKLEQKIFDSILKGKCLTLACHSVGNFVIQRVFENIVDKERFKEICIELEKHLEEILSAGYTGVLFSQAKACVRLETYQSPFMSEIISALHCDENQELIAPCLAHMATKEAIVDKSKVFPVNLHGSLILQELLLFGKPIKIVRSLLTMSASELKTLLSDPRGCHITENFMSSKTVGEKSREGLVKALKGEFASLACSKHGSRTVDTLWKFSSMKAKQSMVEELSSKIDILNSNKFGKFISNSWFLAIFKRNKDDWRNLVEKGKKVSDMFSEILGETNPSLKRKHEESVQKDEKNNSKKEVKEVADIVDDWLSSDTVSKVAKKKKKAKSYLDDL